MKYNNGLSIVSMKADEIVIDIFGTIGYNYWESDKEKQNTTQRIAETLKKIKDKNVKSIIVNINSLGGDVNTALSIYDLLKDHTATVTTKINGLCASAATIIAMAGDVRQMSNNALFLIHRCMTSVYSANKFDLQEALDTVNKVDDRAINIYTNRTGNANDVIQLMDTNNGSGKWITAQEALDNGFITDIYNNATSDMAACSMEDINDAHLPVIPTDSKIDFSNSIQNIVKMTLIQIFPVLCAALMMMGTDTAYDEKAGLTLTDEQLHTLEDLLAKITEKETRITELENKVTEKETRIAELESKVTELKTIIANTPAPDGKVNGDDGPTQHDVMDNEYYQNIQKEMGIV